MILKLTPDIKTRLLLYRGRLERKTLERPETDRQKDLSLEEWQKVNVLCEVTCAGAEVIYLSYSVGSGLMAADKDLFSGSGLSTSSLSSSSSDSSRPCTSSLRSSLLLLSSSLLLRSSSLLWLFLDLPTSTAFP